MPDRLRDLQQLFVIEAGRHQVFPLDDRVTERENPVLAGRLDLHHGRVVITLGPRTGRLTEEAAPNVKNRSHTISVLVDVDDRADGVLVAQGGRFGGWSLYCRDGVLSYAYNCYGRDLTTVRAGRPVPSGSHELGLGFCYDGGPPGDGAQVSLQVDGVEVGAGRLSATTAFYFAFDETLNVGVDRGTPVTDDYAPVRNAFSGSIHRVRFELGPQRPLEAGDRRRVRLQAFD
jgi:arylsulfatase